MTSRPPPSDSREIYRGFRSKKGELTVFAGGRVLTPYRAQALRNCSPTGFEWGYGGSGPALLALAILLDATDNSAWSLEHHQDFKANFIVPADRDSFGIYKQSVLDWARENGWRTSN